MLLNWLSHYGLFITISASLIALSKPKYTFITICSIAILAGGMLGLTKNFNSMFWLQLSVMFAMIVSLIFNKKYKYGGIYQIFLVSVGFLMLALQETNQEFLFQLISQIFHTTDVDKMMFIADIYYLTALLFIIGFIPYADWMMYIFASSSSFLKLVCFVMPLLFICLHLQDVNNIISARAFVFFGTIMSIYSGICLLFDNKIRRIFVNIIVFFFGMQIILFSNKQSQSTLPIFILLSLLILSLSHIFTKYRTLIYTLYRMKQIFFSNFIYKTLSISSFLFLIITFLFYSLKIQDINAIATTIIVGLFLIFICKILYVSIKNFNIKTEIKTMSSANIAISNNTSGINIFRVIFTSIILLSSYILIINKFVNHYATFIYPEKNELIAYGAFLLIGLIISKLLVLYQRPPFLRSNIYFNFIKNQFYHLKIAGKIVVIAFQDFFTTMYNYFYSLLKSSSPNKLSYILYNNQLYFYIFFLVQLIIVITIECIIS